MQIKKEKQEMGIPKKKGARTVHIFDDVFRTMCEKMPKLLIPLINEAFGTSYDEDDELEQLRNERHLDGSMIITDALVKIREHLYHIECQSTDSDYMILRMFEYDAAIAIEHWREIPDGFEISFPKSCIVYIRGETTKGRNKKLVVRFPDGQSCLYTLKVIEVQKYSKCEIFQKKLLMFLPYYILRYEKNLPLKKDKKQFEKLINEYKSIFTMLEEALPDDKGLYYARLVMLIDRISRYVTRNRKNLQKGLGGTMGGKVLKLKIDKMLEDSEAKGEAIGIVKGEKNKEYVCFANCLNRGYSFEDAKVLSGATDEAANEHYERWLQEKKDI